jgi:beta-N-acetylhexosaminidase
MPYRPTPKAGSFARRVLGWLGFLAVTSCGPATPLPAPVSPKSPESQPARDTTAAGTSRADTLSWAERTLEGLSLRQKVAQMIMPSLLGDFSPVGSAGWNRITRLIDQDEVGGILMSVGSPTEVASKLNALQERSKLPLLVASDLETGAGFRFRGAIQMPGTIPLGGATEFPYPMAVGATGDSQLAYEMGAITAEEGRAIGVQIPFAPVLDVNDNPNNPIINVRSFGGDPDEVARLGCAFVRGVQDHGAIATGKHFPGHGDTDVDTHLAMPVVHYDRAHLDSIELKPFQMAIDSGIGAIMSAHIAVPALNGGTDDPATLSKDVLTGLLRNQMGFRGLIFTDAMDMSALTRNYPDGEAAIRAVLAGADVLIQPLSVETDLDAIVEAVENGRIPESRIDASVLHILQVKHQLGLDRRRTVDLAEIPEVVGIPAHQKVAEEIARRSITVLRNRRGLLPLRGTRSARVLSVTYRRPSDVLAGRYFDGRLRHTYPRLATAELDEDTPAAVYAGLERRARRSALVVVSTYVTAVSYRGSVALPKETSAFIEKLHRMGVPHVVVTFGNPYLISEFPDVQAYVLAWSGSRESQEAAADALFGEFAIEGHTPTAIPPFYKIGDGLAIPARQGASGG